MTPAGHRSGAAGIGPGTWTDGEGRVVAGVEPPASGSYYGPIGDFQGADYERNAFARGTEQEVGYLVEALGLRPGQRVLDVGCGTGRHARMLAELGLEVVGIDLSAGLLRAARDRSARASFVQADARALPVDSGWADAVVCLCQGGFGITPGGDTAVLGEIARVVRTGGRVALTAFSLAFAARHLAPEDAIDLARGLVHSPAEVRGPDATRRVFDLWTSCYSPAHLVDLCAGVGLLPLLLSGVEPGAYRARPPTLSDPELLIVTERR